MPDGAQANPPGAHRAWRAHLVVLGLLVGVGTLPFWLTDLDLRVAGYFYDTGQFDPWPLAQAPTWNLLYQLAPPIAAMLLLGSLGTMLAGTLTPAWRRLRIRALFIFAVVALGPGLIVNAVLKEHWGRPRPHQLAEFGYTEAYQPPLAINIAGDGKSFPCGHCSVGFTLVAFALIWHAHRLLAFASLMSALLAGSLLGVARMSAGDHFLSDVIWSAIVVYATALTLYYGVLRIPAREASGATDAPRPNVRHPRLIAAAYGLAALLTLAAVLLATPVRQTATSAIADGIDPPPRELVIAADSADIRLYWSSTLPGGHTGTIRLKVRGFGLPGSRVEQSNEISASRISYRFTHHGVFTERDVALSVALVPAAWDLIRVRTGSGDVRIMTSGDEPPVLDVATQQGAVMRIAPDKD